MCGLDDNRVLFELDAEQIVGGKKRPRQLAGAFRFDVDGVRMFVDEVANLLDAALGENAALIDQQDVRRHRLDLVKDVARDDDALAVACPVLDQFDRLAAVVRIHAGERLTEVKHLRISNERMTKLYASSR